MLSVLVKRHPFCIAGVEKVQHAGADRSAVNLMHGTRVGGQLRTVLLGSLVRTALLDAIGLEVKNNKAVPGFDQAVVRPPQPENTLAPERARRT